MLSQIGSSILAADDLPRRCVSCPEWGCNVWVRTLNGDDLVELQDSFSSISGVDKKDVFARTIVATACDENGVSLFANTPEMVAALRKKSAKVLLRLFNASRELNGIDEAESVPELAKN